MVVSLLFFGTAREQLLELTLIISNDHSQLRDFFVVRVRLGLALVHVCRGDLDDLLIQTGRLIFKVFAVLAQLCDILMHLCLVLLGGQSFPCSVGDAGLVETLISLDVHAHFIANTNEQEAALSAFDGDLTDELVEALRVKFLTNGADTAEASRSLLEGLLKVVLQVDNVLVRRGLG